MAAFTSGCSGTTRPAERIMRAPSSTDMCSRITFSVFTNMMKPDVGFGVVGTKTPI